jgi:hypothetical protein
MNDEIVKQFLDNPVEGRLALSASLKNFIAFFSGICIDSSLYSDHFTI